MSGVWMASYVVLWAAVAVLLVMVLALVRQIGVLHERLDAGAAEASGSSAPANEPAAAEGPALGSAAPMPGRIGYDRAPMTLVAFTSSTCELSQVLVPALRVVDKQYADVRVLELPLGPRTLGAFEAFNVSHTPYVVAVGQDGRVRARGRARNLHQLEAFVARALALATRGAAPRPEPVPEPEPTAPPRDEPVVVIESVEEAPAEAPAAEAPAAEAPAAEAPVEAAAEPERAPV